VNWVRVKSKMLSAIAYDGDWRQLYLRFRSGDIYCCRDVPGERYDELLAADSKGEYARCHILKRYPHQHVSSAVRDAS
jgi:hypothetical protein